MTEQTEQVLSEAIAVMDLPWGTCGVLTAGMRLQVIRTTRKERLQGRLRGIVRRPYEVCIATARNNQYSFVGFKKYEDAAQLVDLMAALPPKGIAEALVEIDKLDAGCRSACLLSQWHEVCLAWTWGHFAPGDVVCLDETIEVETVDGIGRFSSLQPFVLNDVLLEEERTVLALSSTGDVLSLDISDVTLLSPGPGTRARESDQKYAYAPGYGYVQV